MGLTITEMMFVVVLVGLLIVILVPVIRRFHSHATVAICTDNLRKIGAALNWYQTQNNGWLPANQLDGSWRTYLDPALKSPFEANNWKGVSSHWKCPAGGEYFANNLILGDNRYDREKYVTHWKINQFPRAIQVPVVADSKAGQYAQAAIGNYSGVDFRHDGGAVILFLDWRVERVESTNATVSDWWNEPVSGKPRMPPPARP
ncbi:MAG: hypothetical protein HYU36_14085 [Planctomycetes bacterium]|nr:hypothetical protein [Planctomycetota bacterium]